MNPRYDLSKMPLDWKDAEAERGSLFGKSLKGWTLERCTLSHLQICDAKISIGHWVDSEIKGAELRDVVFEGIHFENVFITDSFFSNVTFRLCSFRNFEVSGTGSAEIRFERCWKAVPEVVSEASPAANPDENEVVPEASKPPNPTELFGRFSGLGSES